MHSRHAFWVAPRRRAAIALAVMSSAWLVAAPVRAMSDDAPPPDALLFGEATRVFFGVNPGAMSETLGLTPGSTGVTNIGGGLQAGLAGFAGGLWSVYHVAPTRTMMAQTRAQVSLSSLVDRLTTPGDTNTGYALGLTLDTVNGEWLEYVTELAGMPTFAGAWGSLSGLGFSISKAAATGASSARSLTLPYRLSVGGGVGRVYPVQWRVVIKRMERVLLEDGALKEPLPGDVVARLLTQWYADRDYLAMPASPEQPYGNGTHRHLLRALQTVQDAGLLAHPVHLMSAYRLERILLDENQIDRWTGWEARAGFRLAGVVNQTWSAGVNTDLDTDPSLGIELMARRYYNLSLESDLRVEPSLGVALRRQDEAGNLLTDARRLSLSAPPAASGVAPFLASGRLVCDLPVTYTRYLYDPAYNLTGHWNVHAGASTGVANDAFAIGVMAGASYTFFTDSRTGFTFGLNGGVGRADGLVYNLNVVAVIGLGTGEEFYNAPDQVGDIVPFDTGWMPSPEKLGVP